MPFFTGNADFRGERMRQMLLTQCSINSTAIDMNFKPITSLKNPVQPQDAATRWYVDSRIDEFSSTLDNPYAGFLVTLSGTDPTDVANLRPGSYIVTITPLNDGYPTALYAISKSSIYSEGHIYKITGVAGSYTPEQLELLWPPGNVLKLRKTGPGFDGEYVVDMNMKNTSDLGNPPEIPTDICDKAYVDTRIREQLDIRFGGIIVTLNDTAFTKVMNLRCGSYVIAVTPLQMEGAPTATFAVSKNTSIGSASIVRVSAVPGVSAYSEQLQLIWPENSMIAIGKSGPGYDGQYLVDMNLKNFSSVPESIIPTDAATIAYVDRQIEARMQAHFSGITVNLRDTTCVNVANLRPGSYMIAVTSLVTGGPVATFAISKNSPFAQASVFRASHVPGIETGECLELLWPENGKLMLRKTGQFYDGEYMVDFNLKNISTGPVVPLLPDDQANKAYVDQQIQSALQLELEGVTVHLQDTELSSVAALKCGSYLVAVSARVHAGPCATFAISKATNTSTPSIFRMTSCPGLDSGEHVELLWPENSKLLLRKTGPAHDGEFLVDMNLKNFSGAAPSLIMQDVATCDFVLEQIQKRMQAHFAGIDVDLKRSDFTPVAALQPGSYLIAVTSKVPNGPTGTFAVSKSSHDGDASIQRMTACPGLQGEQLELLWPLHGKLQVRKTGETCDGVYVVDLNLKNFTCESSTSQSSPALLASMPSLQQVQLVGIDSVSLKTTLRGSYTVHVTPVLDGPAASFSLTKASSKRSASICSLTQATGDPTIDSVPATMLVVEWPNDSTVCVKKTSAKFDGVYEVKII